MLPSALLSNEQLVQQAFTLFYLEKLNAMKVVGQEDEDEADLFMGMLCDRFHDHIKSRIESKARHTHWSMKLV